MKIKVACVILERDFGADNHLKLFFRSLNDYETECNKRKYNQFITGRMTNEEKIQFLRNIQNRLNCFPSSWYSIYGNSIEKGEVTVREYKNNAVIDMCRGYDTFHIYIYPADIPHDLIDVVRKIYQ